MPEDFWLNGRDVGAWLPLERLKPGSFSMVLARLRGEGTWQDVNDRFAAASPSMARATTVDGGALAVGLGFVGATALLTGLLPAFRAARADVTALLSRRPGATIVRRGRCTTADLLVVLQVGLAVVLLVVTAMLLRLGVRLIRTPLTKRRRRVGSPAGTLADCR